MRNAIRASPTMRSERSTPEPRYDLRPADDELPLLERQLLPRSLDRSLEVVRRDQPRERGRPVDKPEAERETPPMEGVREGGSEEGVREGGSELLASRGGCVVCVCTGGAPGTTAAG